MAPKTGKTKAEKRAAALRENLRKRKEKQKELESKKHDAKS